METSATASSVNEKGIAIRKNEALPATISKLKSFVIFQEETAKNYKSRLLLLKETNAAKAQVDVTFEDALKVSQMLFDAYQRLGQLVEKHTAKPKESGKTGGRGKKGKGHSNGTSLLTVRGLAREMKVSESWLEQMKLISKNQRFADEAFKLARQKGPEAGTPPTKTHVINTIRSAERHFHSKRHKPQPSELGKCTEAILQALRHLKGADWRGSADQEIPAFNDAVSDFQQRVAEFQIHIKRETEGEPEVAPNAETGQEKLRQQGLFLRWMLNWKLLFRRLFMTTAGRA